MDVGIGLPSTIPGIRGRLVLDWARAAEEVHWFRPWDTTFTWDPPTFRWFEGGLTNLSWNCLDYHVERSALRPARGACRPVVVRPAGHGQCPRQRRRSHGSMEGG